MKKKEHAFTKQIISILEKNFPDNFNEIFEKSELIQYLNIKTKSANKGSKARGSFANHYALYVLIEDYLAKKFGGDNGKDYSKYEGANFSDLLQRQRQLPFGQKLQNHALNSRLNDEFKKYFPNSEYQPILRDVVSTKYWINENFLKIQLGDKNINLSKSIIEIIDCYVETKKASFDSFISDCLEIQNLPLREQQKAFEFIKKQLDINVDARIFEIVSYSILKVKYQHEHIYIGLSRDSVEKEHLMLFKTGRTNANDGGIDFVMKPLGRFFQVTETTDLKKYFLDIEKVMRYPITFVIKSSEDPSTLLEKIKLEAHSRYSIEKIVNRYMSSIEEIITVNTLLEILENLIDQSHLDEIIQSIVIQSKLEFNYEDIDDPISFIEYSEDLKDAYDDVTN